MRCARPPETDSAMLNCYPYDLVMSDGASSEGKYDEASQGDFSEGNGTVDSGMAQLAMPKGYMLPTTATRTPQVPGPLAVNTRGQDGSTDVQRLLLMAKHPNASPDQVKRQIAQTQATQARRFERQQKKQLEEQQQNSGRPISFSPAFPVDSDTGEAWERKQQLWQQHRHKAIMEAEARKQQAHLQQTPAPFGALDRSMDSEWDDSNSERQDASAPFLKRVWRKVFTSQKDAEEVSVPPSDCNASKTSQSMNNISLNSEKTPKMSNVDMRARAKRMRHETGQHNCFERAQMACGKLCTTPVGKWMLALMVVLILAILVTIVAAAAAAGRKEKQAQFSESSGGLISRQPIAPTLEPILAPGDEIGAPTVFPGEIELESPSVAPVTRGIDLESPTLLPTRNPTRGAAAAETTAPAAAVWASTLAPVALATPTLLPAPLTGPTSAPTIRRTASPTRQAILAPVRAPSPRPTTRAPSAKPTTDFFDTPLTMAGGGSIEGDSPDQLFGQSVAMSDDGTILAVGAPNTVSLGQEKAGSVQVYELLNGSWEVKGDAILGRNDGDQFGQAIALSADGSILVASEPSFSGRAGDRAGNVRVFQFANGQYEPMGQELEGAAATDNFGTSVAVSADGRRIVVGSPFHDAGGSSTQKVSGKANVYEWTGTAWEQVGADLIGNQHRDWFGLKVDLSADGNTLCVGAPRNFDYGGYVQCFSFFAAGWLQMGDPIRNTINPVRFDDNFGSSLKVSGDRVAIGAPGKNNDAVDAGLVAVYEWGTTGSWERLGSSIALNSPTAADQFGSSVDIVGDIMTIGSPGKGDGGQVNVYKLVEEENGQKIWKAHPGVLFGEEGSTFGKSIKLTPAAVVVGNPETPGSNSGRVSVYTVDTRAR